MGKVTEGFLWGSQAAAHDDFVGKEDHLTAPELWTEPGGVWEPSQQRVLGTGRL